MGHDVRIKWQTAGGSRGWLVVVDGPLQQPFDNYMEMSDDNSCYDLTSIETKSVLHELPKDQRITFDEVGRTYGAERRLEAMKVAKAQALVRETAAGYIKDGLEVPTDLAKRYDDFLRKVPLHGGSLVLEPRIDVQPCQRLCQSTPTTLESNDSPVRLSDMEYQQSFRSFSANPPSTYVVSACAASRAHTPCYA